MEVGNESKIIGNLQPIRITMGISILTGFRMGDRPEQVHDLFA